MEQFIGELRACGWDICEWFDRKGQENESFTGLQIDKEKLNRLNNIIALCVKLRKADKKLTFDVRPVEPNRRHGIVKLILPSANGWMSREVLDAFSELCKLSDHIHLVVPSLIVDDEDDLDEPVEDKNVYLYECPQLSQAGAESN